MQITLLPQEVLFITISNEWFSYFYTLFKFCIFTGLNFNKKNSELQLIASWLGSYYKSERMKKS